MHDSMTTGFSSVILKRTDVKNIDAKIPRAIPIRMSQTAHTYPRKKKIKTGR